jgi:hypothetical protein
MLSKRALFLFFEFDTGIASTIVREYGAGGSEAVGVLVENDRALIFNELEDK